TKQIAAAAKPTEATQLTTAQQPSTTQQSQPVAQTPNTSGGLDVAVWVALVAVVAAAAVAIALRRKPKR
ncbi:MAG: hypothetical protein GU356_04470, partial [Pyrobaculum sp.]|nr:hypothetical protein [Pyrobaculum sp.]